MPKYVTIEKLERVALLRLERPPVNAVDLDLARELGEQVRKLEADEVGAVVVTGAGENFSAGLDLKLVPEYNRDQQLELIQAFEDMLSALYRLRRPVVAAMNGNAIAGGLVLALTADYRVAADGPYKVGLTEVRVGISFPPGALSLVRSELTGAAARRLVLGAENVDPREAERLEVVDEPTPPAQVLDRAIERADAMAQLPALTFGRVKHQLRAATLAEMDENRRGGFDSFVDGWIHSESRERAAKVMGRGE